MKALLFVAAFVAAAAAASVDFALESPAGVWSSVGSRSSLVCRASQPVKSCSWLTPAGTVYVVDDGFSAESGRLGGAGENEFECGISIERVGESDSGVWSCHVGVEDGNGVKSAKGQAPVMVAQGPGEVVLMEPHDVGYVNVTDFEPVDVLCAVKDAMPAPSFSWMVDDVPLEKAETSMDKTEDNSTWIQGLRYVPDVSHANRTLRCVVSHIGLEGESTTSAEAVLRFNVVEEGLAEPTAAEDEGDSAGGETGLVPALATLAVVVALLVVMFSSWVIRQKRRAAAATASEQPPKEPTAAAEGGEAESSEETTAEAKDDDSAVETSPDGPLCDEKTKAAGEGCFARVFMRSSKDAPAKDVEAGGEAEEVENADDRNEEAPIASSFSALLKLFRQSAAAKKEDEVEEKSGEDKVKEEEAVPRKAEQMAELEPEDKPEVVADLTDKGNEEDEKKDSEKAPAAAKTDV